jgi:hypothetical protein
MDFLLNAEVFSEFRPIFIMLLIFLGVFLVLSLIPRSSNTKITFFTVLTVSITHALIAGALLVTENWFLGEFQLDGDPMTFGLFVGVIVLAIANPIIYKVRNKNRRSMYSFR